MVLYFKVQFQSGGGREIAEAQGSVILNGEWIPRFDDGRGTRFKKFDEIF